MEFGNMKKTHHMGTCVIVAAVNREAYAAVLRWAQKQLPQLCAAEYIPHLPPHSAFSRPFAPDLDVLHVEDEHYQVFSWGHRSRLPRAGRGVDPQPPPRVNGRDMGMIMSPPIKRIIVSLETAMESVFAGGALHALLQGHSSLEVMYIVPGDERSGDEDEKPEMSEEEESEDEEDESDDEQEDEETDQPEAEEWQ
ncbi:hypothetical protein K461DRAFT_297439 [Myriangium duriaei CBS 260.36]|uniref:Uncharacterized protein n=1 Tax=Myriangium duriaei CBS 260.36 TaxID=1168546 RepID=A0A9P4MGI3_9PEZI|nr:hypothetical protein K461DRAFT_297439 [Myriangium duriaei CBS 260.36]